MMRKLVNTLLVLAFVYACLITGDDSATAAEGLAALLLMTLVAVVSMERGLEEMERMKSDKTSHASVDEQKH